MKAIDLFFYTAYLFLVKLGRSEDNAKWSALCHISFFSVIVSAIGLMLGLFGSSSKRLAANFPTLLILGAFFFIIYYFRFYKTSVLNEVDQYYLSLSKIKIKIVSIIYGIVNVLIFFLVFFLAFINKGQL